jgi:hypothetical protein
VFAIRNRLFKAGELYGHHESATSRNEAIQISLSKIRKDQNPPYEVLLEFYCAA